MNIIVFAGKFAAALLASLAVMLMISTGVDMIYGPTGSTVAQVEKTAQDQKTTPAAAAPAPKTAAPNIEKVEKPQTVKTETLKATTQTEKTAAPKPVIVAAAAKPAKKKRHPGRKIYQRKGACAACHGRNGKRAISYYPSIAGQDKKYIIQQVKDIMKEKRKGGMDKETGHLRAASMRGALVTQDGGFRITDDDIVQMADWLKGLPPAKPRTPEVPIPAENIAKGKKLFKKCISCHGKEGKKPLKGYPFVAGQKRQYLSMQLIDIRDGIRKNGKSKLMLPFVKKLTDERIGLISDYLSMIDRTKK